MPIGKQYTEFHIWHNYGGALSRQVALWRQQQGILRIGYTLKLTNLELESNSVWYCYYVYFQLVKLLMTRRQEQYMNAY